MLSTSLLPLLNLNNNNNYNDTDAGSSNESSPRKTWNGSRSGTPPFSVQQRQTRLFQTASPLDFTGQSSTSTEGFSASSPESEWQAAEQGARDLCKFWHDARALLATQSSASPTNKRRTSPLNKKKQSSGNTIRAQPAAITSSSSSSSSAFAATPVRNENSTRKRGKVPVPNQEIDTSFAAATSSSDGVASPNENSRHKKTKVQDEVAGKRQKRPSKQKACDAHRISHHPCPWVHNQYCPISGPQTQ
jgi:hypothetical protein